MADSMTPAQKKAALVSLLIEVVDGAKAVRYFNLASWLFCTYDWILNLDREVELIWKRKFTSLTYFYLFNRYVSGIFLTISMFTYVQEYNIGDTLNSFEDSVQNDSVTLMLAGREWWKYEAFTCTICFQLVELVLGLRVYALWKKSKAIGVIVGIFYILEVLGQLIIIGIYFTHDFTATDTPFREYGIEDFHLCVPTTNTSYVYSFWFPALAYGTLIVVLAGWKGVQRYRDTRGSTSRSNGQWVLDIFIRDSLIYYVLLALLELAISILWHSGPSALVQLLIGFGMAAPIVLCSKLILNLRGAYYDYSGGAARNNINLATEHTASEYSRGIEMAAFGGIPYSKVGQISSRDTKHPILAYPYTQATAPFYNDDEWAAKRFDQSLGYR